MQVRWHTVASELRADARRSSIRLQLLQQLRQAWIQNLVQYRLVEGLQLKPEPQACAGIQDRFVVGHHGCRQMRVWVGVHHGHLQQGELR